MEIAGTLSFKSWANTRNSQKGQDQTEEDYVQKFIFHRSVTLKLFKSRVYGCLRNSLAKPICSCITAMLPPKNVT